MSTRIFLKNLSSKTSEQDLSEIFGKFGEIAKIDLKSGFGFIYYVNSEDASEAIKSMDNKEVDGRNIIVEIARHNDKTKPPRRLDLRVSVFNIDSRISWQDLKDWAREAGDVTFTNVFMRDQQHVGVVEFQDKDGMEKALRILEDVPLKGIKVRLEKDDQNHDTRGSRPRESFRDQGDAPYRSYEDSRGAPPARGYDDRGEGSRGGGYRGGYEQRGYGGPPPPGPGHYDSRGGYGDGYGGGRYSDDYRRGPPGGVPPPFYGDGPSYRGREGRSRSRSRERSFYPDPRGPAGPYRGYGGGAPPRGYDARDAPRGAGGPPPRYYDGPSRGGAYEGSRGGR